MRGTDTTTDPQRSAFADMVDAALSETGFGYLAVNVEDHPDPVEGWLNVGASLAPPWPASADDINGGAEQRAQSKREWAAVEKAIELAHKRLPLPDVLLSDICPWLEDV